MLLRHLTVFSAVAIFGFVVATPVPQGKQTIDGSCGGSKGFVCLPGACCSQWGWCGSSAGHCGAGCQSAFGICSGGGGPPTVTSSTRTPTSTSTTQPTTSTASSTTTSSTTSITTSTTPSPTPTTPGEGRPRPGNLPYGTGIASCNLPGVIALTYDDGPFAYTGALLDILRAKGVKATFFVNGRNWGEITTSENQALVRRMVAEGHQVGSHTFSHPNLDTLSYDAIQAEMRALETPLINILGKYPNYMRPPFLNCAGTCEAALGALAYHVIQADLDTQDWRNTGPQAIQTSKNIFKAELDTKSLDGNGVVVLAHDVHEYTVTSLTEYMIDYARSKGWRFTTVGECMGDPEENWYISA